MTDNKIKKAMETLIAITHKDMIFSSNGTTYGNVLDLINRLQAEVEGLKNHIQEGIDLAKQIPEMLALTKAEAYKEVWQKLTREMLACGQVDVDEFFERLVGENV